MELEREDGSEPTDDEVDDKIEQLKKQSRKELARARFFFENACVEMSFVRLRKKMSLDKELTGYAAWEVMRDKRGYPRRFKYAPSWTIRAMPIQLESVEVTSRVKVSDIAWEEQREYRQFRRYIQIHCGIITYFKEFGDPRVLSADSGVFYKDIAAFKRAEPGKRLATELLWFSLDSPESDVYGYTRWLGNTLSVLGSREMEEVNFTFWQHKSIPPLAILIAGGHLAKGAAKKIRKILRDKVKGGGKNFHSALVIEAEPVSRLGAASAGALSSQSKVKIDMKPLTEAIWKDQLWGNYDSSNRLKVGGSFRIPPIVRGETKDFNRATAEAALDFAEAQVFQPERQEFDYEMNRSILPALDVWLWRFVSNGPVVKQPEKVVEFVEKLSQGTLSINEARQIVGSIFGVELPKIDQPWADLPLKAALAGLEPETDDNDDNDEEDGDYGAAMRIEDSLLKELTGFRNNL